jgi:hypothetical protein
MAKKCNIIIAPRAVSTETTAHSFNGYKAWVEGNTAFWEHGDTKEQAENKMRISLECQNMEIGKVIHQMEPA